MDSELPHCTVCLKPLASGWRCPEHRDPAPAETCENPTPVEVCEHYIGMRSHKLECGKCGAAYVIGMDGCRWEARP